MREHTAGRREAGAQAGITSKRGMHMPGRKGRVGSPAQCHERGSREGVTRVGNGMGLGSLGEARYHSPTAKAGMAAQAGLHS